MEREQFFRILKEMHMVCEQVNEELKKREPDNKLRYEVLQFSDLARDWDSVYKIADFYNNNWLGNKDFMHIPNCQQVLENCKKYPIIIAREEGEKDILGISAIKYDENSKDTIDPYFPEEDAKYFSITGILVKRGTTHKGMGKKIYEIAIRGAHEYNKVYPGTRIMCVIDCRNNHSLRALSTAVENINVGEKVGENRMLPANIVGYYELRNPEDGKLEEAPTLVLEVGLDDIEKTSIEKSEKTLEYKEVDGQSLFDSLTAELREKVQAYGLAKPIVMKDDGCGIVYYYSLQSDCVLEGTKIIPNGTEQGNDRKPMVDETLNTVYTPLKISVDMEER